MPKYSFGCEGCSLTFTRTLKMGEHPHHPCPACKGEASRVFEGFGFGFAEGGSAPGNSGVSKHDYPTADLAVGRDSDDRWGEIRARDAVKEKVRQVGGHRALIRRNGRDYVEYEAAGEKLIDHRKNVVAAVNKAVKTGT